MKRRMTFTDHEGDAKEVFTMADSTRRDINKRVTALIIHGFTIAHVVAAGILGPAAGSVLAPMTGAMVIAIGAQCSAGFSVKKALKVMANFVGFILGVSIAEFLVGLIPGIGNIANAIATGIVTEMAFPCATLLHD